MTFFKIYHWRKKAIPFLISGLIISCSPLNPLGLASGEYTAIAELGKISNQSNITLKGIVVNIAPFLEGGAYQLQDATGTVWVRTDKPLPPKGSSLAVKGELKYEAIFVGKQQLGESYLLELSQEPQSSVSSTEQTPVPTPSDRPPTVSKPPLLLPIQAETPPTTPIPQSPTLETPPPPLKEPVSTPPVQAETPTPIPSSQPIQVPNPSPSSPPPNKPEQNKVINPVVPSPRKSTPTKPPAKINVDDQFLPHKRLQK